MISLHGRSLLFKTLVDGVAVRTAPRADARRLFLLRRGVVVRATRKRMVEQVAW